MRAILIGGPRHLHEFEIGEPPPSLVVPELTPTTRPGTIDQNPRATPQSHFRTVEYVRQPQGIGQYVLYLCREPHA